MPRELTFRIKKKEYRAVPVRIERRKLYGWSEIAAFDDAGDPCKLISTDDAGKFMIPIGGTGQGVLSPRGEWVKRSELKAVKEDGSPARLLPSSFSVTVGLTEKVSPEELLDYSMTAFYQLDEASPEFIKAVGEGIYRFSFCYVEDCDANPAFVLASDDLQNGKQLFMLTGYHNRFDMVGLEQPGLIDETEDEPEEGTDDLDLSML